MKMVVRQDFKNRNEAFKINTHVPRSLVFRGQDWINGARDSIWLSRSLGDFHVQLKNCEIQQPIAHSGQAIKTDLFGLPGTGDGVVGSQCVTKIFRNDLAVTWQSISLLSHSNYVKTVVDLCLLIDSPCIFFFSSCKSACLKMMAVSVAAIKCFYFGVFPNFRGSVFKS